MERVRERNVTAHKILKRFVPVPRLAAAREFYILRPVSSIPPSRFRLHHANSNGSSGSTLLTTFFNPFLLLFSLRAG